MPDGGTSGGDGLLCRSRSVGVETTGGDVVYTGDGGAILRRRCDGVVLEISGGRYWVERGAMRVREGDVVYVM